MSFRKLHPGVKRIHKTYQTGVKLTQKQMTKLEQRFVRLDGLSQWFVQIIPCAHPCSSILLE